MDRCVVVYQNCKIKQTQYERLTNSQRENIKEYLPTQRKRKYDLRQIVDSLFWILRVGSQWRNLPKCFPPWQSVYYFFRKWKKDGTLQKFNEGLNRKERQRQGKEPRPSMLSIDSQSIEAGPFISQDKGIDGNQKINGRKRHVITDTLGLVWSVVVRAANLNDGATASQVVTTLVGYLHRLNKILSDAAYEIVFRNWVYENMLGVELELSSKPPSIKGFVPVKWRWLTEQTFGRFNYFRRLDKDHQKSVHSSEAWVLWHNCQTIIYRLPS